MIEKLNYEVVEEYGLDTIKELADKIDEIIEDINELRGRHNVVYEDDEER